MTIRTMRDLENHQEKIRVARRRLECWQILAGDNEYRYYDERCDAEAELRTLLDEPLTFNAQHQETP